MGNRQSDAVHSAAPNSFFLVVGGPPIRYVGVPPSRGPLMFDVETERPGDDVTVQRAETVQLQVAVPPKQSFKLTQLDPVNKNLGFLLSFSLRMIKPGETLRVFAGVDVEYVPGEGVRLTQSKKSQNPFCIYDVVSPEDFKEEIEVSEALQLQRLSHAVISDNGSAAKRLTYAPIAVELMYGIPVKTPITMIPREVVGGREGVMNRVQSASSYWSPASLTAAASIEVHTTRILQYTFLDFSDEPLERRTLTSFLLDGINRTSERPVYEAKVVKHLLQRGTEVYDLDLFDLGDFDEIDNVIDGEDTGLCVICLTNPRDTTLLPCRHMCFCHECIAMLQLQQNNCCPVCRAAVVFHMTL